MANASLETYKKEHPGPSSLYYEDFIDDPNDLIPFIREGYGKAYDAEIVAKYINKHARIITLMAGLGRLAAVAMLDGRRLVTGVTSTDHEVFGSSRSALYVHLLAACHQEGTAAWGTVGVKYAKVQTLWQRAGLARVSDAGVIQSLIEENQAQNYYSIQPDPEAASPGLVVVGGNNYAQQVWVWPDRCDYGPQASTLHEAV